METSARVLAAGALLSLTALSGCLTPGHQSGDLEPSAMSVSELVKMYSAPAGDDVAGPEFQRRGVKARDELIRMLDGVQPRGPLEDEFSWTIVHILDICLPSEES